METFRKVLLRRSGIVLLFLMSSHLALAEDKPVEEGHGRIKDRIAKAWKAHAAPIQSVRFTWKETRSYRKGSQFPPLMARIHRLSGAALTEGIPYEDTTLTVPLAELIVEGGRMKYKSAILAIEQTGEVSMEDYVSGYDGSTSAMLVTKDDHNAQGGTLAENRNTNAALCYVRPVVLWCCPLDKEVSYFDLESAQVTRMDEVVRGRETVRVEQGRERLWLDPNRQFRVVRWERTGTRKRFDIEYAEDKQWGWVPSTWEGTLYTPAGLVAAEIWAEVLSYEVNPRITKGDFAVHFPPHAEVYDQKTQSFVSPLILQSRHIAFYLLNILGVLALTVLWYICSRRRGLRLKHDSQKKEEIS